MRDALTLPRMLIGEPHELDIAFMTVQDDERGEVVQGGPCYIPLRSLLWSFVEHDDRLVWVEVAVSVGAKHNSVRGRLLKVELVGVVELLVQEKHRLVKKRSKQAWLGMLT